jgi:hypothetical protein
MPDGSHVRATKLRELSKLGHLNYLVFPERAQDRGTWVPLFEDPQAQNATTHVQFFAARLRSAHREQLPRHNCSHYMSPDSSQAQFLSAKEVAVNK